MTNHVRKYNKIKAWWNVFEAGHGKDPCDGLGSYTKRIAMKTSKVILGCLRPLCMDTVTDLFDAEFQIYVFFQMRSLKATGKE